MTELIYYTNVTKRTVSRKYQWFKVKNKSVTLKDTKIWSRRIERVGRREQVAFFGLFMDQDAVEVYKRVKRNNKRV